MGAARKATFSIREHVLTELDEAVANGAAPSKNALVERALVRELDVWRRQMRRALWQQAARDPLLLEDIEEVEEGFRSADTETARRIR